MVSCSCSVIGKMTDLRCLGAVAFDSLGLCYNLGTELSICHVGKVPLEYLDESVYVVIFLSSHLQ